MAGHHSFAYDFCCCCGSTQSGGSNVVDITPERAVCVSYGYTYIHQQRESHTNTYGVEFFRIAKREREKKKKWRQPDCVSSIYFGCVSCTMHIRARQTQVSFFCARIWPVAPDHHGQALPPLTFAESAPFFLKRKVGKNNRYAYYKSSSFSALFTHWRMNFSSLKHQNPKKGEGKFCSSVISSYNTETVKPIGL